MQFDIKEIYPSISKDLLMKAINHAMLFITISKQEVNALMHSRKSLLFNNTSVWVKREGDLDFEVTMGELVGVYILNLVGEKY